MNEEEFTQKALALLNSGKYEKALRGKQVAVIGAGGAGGNIVEGMARNGLNRMEGVDSIVINSDERMMQSHPTVKKKVLIGKNIVPNPNGAGGDRRLARKMVDGARESIEVLISPYPVVVVIAGLGGGTGSELITEISRMSVGAGKVTMAIPVLPFKAESGRRAASKRILLGLRQTGAMVAEMDNEMLNSSGLAASISMDAAYQIINRTIMKKIEDLHSSARKAVMDEIVRDIMAQMETAPAQESPMMEAVEIPQAVTASENAPVLGDAIEINMNAE